MENNTVKWKTLVHSGVLFPPEYTRHGVKMLYDGQPVDLTPEQEEVCAHRLFFWLLNNVIRIHSSISVLASCI